MKVSVGKIKDYHHLKVNTYYLVTDSLGDQYPMFYRGFHYDEEAGDDVLVFWESEKGDGLWIWHWHEFKWAQPISSV